MRKGVPGNQIKALAMAMAGGVVAAVATMFVPTAVLEGLTGATGLSELVPAAAAPLGDTARALIAFSVGAFTLSLLAYLLMRQDSAPSDAAPKTTDDIEQGNSLKDRLTRIAMPKMPWAKGEDDITDLSDLPKLRMGDVHPDAPPRRPLSAGLDLPMLDLANIPIAAPEAEEVLIDTGEEIAPVVAVIHEPVEKIALSVTPPEAPVVPAENQQTLADMVAQLESAVADRKRQLAELEAVAEELDAGQMMARNAASEPAPVDIVEAIPEPLRYQRPPLEAVPAGVKDDDMDSALAAALATLHRMNGTNR